MPAISTVIPARNAAATVGATLDSLLRQTFTDWQALVVDDGSTDRTADVLAHYARRDARIRILRQPGAGLAAARNAALAHCRGRLVHFLDADDLLEPGFFQAMLDILDQHPQAGAAFCGWRYVGANLQEGGWTAAPARSVLTFDDLAADNPIPIHTVLLRAEWLERIGAFETALPVAQDWDFWSRGARCGLTFVGTSEPLALYRMRPDSLSRNPRDCVLAAVRIVQINHGPDPRCKMAAPRWRDGAPREREPAARADAAFNAAVAAVGTHPPEWIADLLAEACGPHIRLDPLQCALRLHTGIPFYRCRFLADWPDLWPQVRADIERLGACLEQRFGPQGLAHRMIQELDKLLRGPQFVLRRIVEHIHRHRSQIRQVILYGMGRNGRYLHEHLEPVTRAIGLALRVADDSIPLEQLLREGFDAVASEHLPGAVSDGAVVIVTPLRAEAMCRRLERTGAVAGRNWLSWSALAEGTPPVEPSPAAAATGRSYLPRKTGSSRPAADGATGGQLLDIHPGEKVS